jgi:hypothetical protein
VTTGARPVTLVTGAAQCVDVNLRVVVLGLRAALPALRSVVPLQVDGGVSAQSGHVPAQTG